MLIFPIRHHSPAAALQVERLIRARRPQAVLIEGPADATPLVPLLLDPETRPPVALYAYRSGETVRRSFYPLCRYSPEYAALTAGAEVGAALHFCDLPAAAVLNATAEDGDHDCEPDADRDGVASDEPAPELPGYEQFRARLAEAAGCESFEEFWEWGFEQEAARGSPEAYVTLLADFGAQARAFSMAPDERGDDRREQHMAAFASSIRAAGTADDAILLVCGAAHVEGIAAAYEAGVEAPTLEMGPVEMTLIPYSFPRLSEQSGYGAGNRAPAYYDRVWQLQGDYAAAARQSLVALAQVLRRHGHVASLAQVIDAYALAVSLARLRGKPAPGLDEIREAAVACLGLGQPALLAGAMQQVLLGERAGTISQRVGRTPLQAEFYATVQRLRLPVQDAPSHVLLHMPIAVEAEASIYLHRLAVAEIPFATQVQSGLGRGPGPVRNNALARLARARERWQVQWTPATDVALIERTAWGSSLAEVCERLFAGRLERAGRIDTGTELLIEMTLCDLMRPFPAALARCEALGADSSSFVALARAVYQIDGLLSYGAARRLPAARLAELATRLCTRAVLQLVPALVCGDDAAREVHESLSTLYELVRRRSTVVDATAFWPALERGAESSASHPALRGLALVLLELGSRLTSGRLSERLRYWLSASNEAGAQAQLVAGLFSLHRGTLVRNRALIAAVTDFLQGLTIERLRPLLPVLRRSLGKLSRAERSYLGETLATVLCLEAADAGAALNLTSLDAALLREADRTVELVLNSWRERYGID